LGELTVRGNGTHSECCNLLRFVAWRSACPRRTTPFAMCSKVFRFVLHPRVPKPSAEPWTKRQRRRLTSFLAVSIQLKSAHLLRKGPYPRANVSGPAGNIFFWCDILRHFATSAAYRGVSAHPGDGTGKRPGGFALEVPSALGVPEEGGRWGPPGVGRWLRAETRRISIICISRFKNCKN
jgi:hypothetical protein